MDHVLGIFTSKLSNWGPWLSADAPSFSLCTLTRPTGLCRHLSPTPSPSLPTSGTYPSETCLCFQPLGMGVGEVCLGDSATCLLLLSFIIRGLSRDRSYSQLKQTLVWERITHGWKRSSGSGPDRLLSMPSIHPLGQRGPSAGACSVIRWQGKVHCHELSGCPLPFGVWSAAAPLNQPLAEGAGRHGVNASLNIFFQFI